MHTVSTCTRYVHVIAVVMMMMMKMLIFDEFMLESKYVPVKLSAFYVFLHSPFTIRKQVIVISTTDDICIN